MCLGLVLLEVSWLVCEECLTTKITADINIAFLKEHLEYWLRKAKTHFQKNHRDNAPSYSAHKTKGYLQKLSFCGSRKMNWPANSPDENLGSILKRHVYENGGLFRSNNL